MSSPDSSNPDHEAFEADFSDYLDGSLAAARAAEVKAHLADCERCRAAYDQFKETVDALSGLHRMSAPQDFDKGVESTIHKRSAGRFFGRKAFGDRVPFELLALLALALALGIYFLIRSSDTGSVKPPFESGPEAPALAPGARAVVPKP